MSSWRRNHSQYAQQRVVATFVDGIIYNNKWGLTHISQAHSYSALINGVEYEVRSAIVTGALPDDELSEELPWTDEEEW
jgi:hypothetical protein